MRNKHYRQWYAILIGLLLAGLWAGWPAHAQDNPDGDSPLIRGHRAEVVFPAVMRFWIHVDVPLERITGAQLTAEQDSGFSRTFSLDPAASVFQSFEDSVELTMTWALTDQPLPRAFIPFTYTWTLTLAPDTSDVSDGEAAASDSLTITLSDTLTLRDPQAGTWESAGEPPLTLHWTAPDLGGRRMRDELWLVYEAVTEQAGRQPDLRFAIAEPDASLCRVIEDSPTGDPIRVVDSTQDRTQYPCDPADYARVYAETGAQLIQRTRPGYDVLQNQLVGAIVQAVYAPLWDDAPPPDWFAAGLAALYRPRADYGDLALVRAAASQDALPAPDPAPPAGATYQEQALWQAQSYTLLLFLADRYGVPAVYELARNPGSDAGDFAARLAAVTDQDESTLWQSFRDWLASDAPDRAIGWTPYAGITPTPSPTPTASPIPPTRTPTRTPTQTPIPTSTFLGAQEATVVRLNVTVTVPRHTVTRTPLPPGSLPTGIPAAGDSDDGTPSNRAIAGLVALAGGGLLLIGLGVLLTLWRRQT